MSKKKQHRGPEHMTVGTVIREAIDVAQWCGGIVVLGESTPDCEGLTWYIDVPGGLRARAGDRIIKYPDGRCVVTVAIDPDAAANVATDEVK